MVGQKGKMGQNGSATERFAWKQDAVAKKRDFWKVASPRNRASYLADWRIDPVTRRSRQLDHPAAHVDG